MVEGKPAIKKPKITLKAVPVVILFGILVPIGVYMIGKSIDMTLNLPRTPIYPFNVVFGIITIAFGYYYGLGSIYQLYQTGLGLPWGDVDSNAQSCQLVTTGLYRETRNPMVLGTIFLISGIGLLAQSLTALLLLPSIFFALIYLWLKYREEPLLEKRFGEAYVTYKKRTPLLIPQIWKRRSQG